MPKQGSSRMVPYPVSDYSEYKVVIATNSKDLEVKLNELSPQGYEINTITPVGTTFVVTLTRWLITEERLLAEQEEAEAEAEAAAEKMNQKSKSASMGR